MISAYGDTDIDNYYKIRGELGVLSLAVKHKENMIKLLTLIKSSDRLKVQKKKHFTIVIYISKCSGPSNSVICLMIMIL